MSAEKLGPIEIEFLLDGKADEQAKKLKGSLDAVGASSKKNAASIKEDIKAQEKFIKGLTAEIKEMQRTYDNMIGSRRKSDLGKELGQAKRSLREAQGDFIRLQREQIEVNNAEGQSIDSLSGKMSKWALSIGGVAAILNTLKNSLLETTGGLNAFNIAGAATKQVLYNIVTGASNLTAGLTEVIAAQRKLNALRIQEKFDTADAKNELIGYNDALIDAHDQIKTTTERIKAYDDALIHKRESVRIELETTEKQKQAYMDILKVSPDNESAKMAILDLRNKQLDLINGLKASMKEISSMRTGLIKKDIEDRKKWREDLHDNLQKLADQQIEIDNSISEQEKLLMKAVEDGNKAEIKAISDRIRLLREELAIRINIAKAAILTSYGGSISKITHLPSAPTLSSKPTLPGLQGASINAQVGADLGKLKIWNEEDLAIEEKKKQVKEEILRISSDITAQLGSQLGLSDDELNILNNTVNTLASLASGDYVGAAASMLSQLISIIPTKAQKIASQIEDINQLLRMQQHLIDRSERSGGGRAALLDAVNLSKQLQKAQQDLLSAESKKLAPLWTLFLGLIGFVAGINAQKKKIEELKNEIAELGYTVEEAQQAYDDFLRGGITENTIADAIAQGFEDGKTSVDDFAAYMDDVLKDAAVNIFKQQILDSPAMKAYVDYLKEALLDRKLADDEKDKIKQMGADLAADMQPFWDALGLSLGENATANQQSLQGSIKGITEETASVLAGQMNAMRINVADTSSMMRQQLLHVAEIAANTRYNKHLESIDRKLDALNTDSLRATGVA